MNRFPFCFNLRKSVKSAAFPQGFATDAITDLRRNRVLEMDAPAQ
jgi:hypothetical protein